MTDNQILIERPIVVQRNKAIIAKELDKLELFLDK